MKHRVATAGLALTAGGLLAFLTLWEGVEYDAYYDLVGVPTVCSGITTDVVMGKTYTKEECDDLLARELKKHGEGFLSCVKVPLSQNEYNAYASWTFNIGINAACKSTLVKKLNHGDYDGACDELLKWNRAGGKVVQGLTNRRQAEHKLCRSKQ